MQSAGASAGKSRSSSSFSVLMTKDGLGQDSAYHRVLSHHLENHWSPDKLRAWLCVCVEGRTAQRLQSVWRQMKHSANREYAVHPADLTGWQQSIEQLVVPALACAHHLSERFGAGCEWLGGEPQLLCCSHDSCLHLAGALIKVWDAAGAFCVLSGKWMSATALQIVNSTPYLRDRDTCTFPFLPFLAWFPIFPSGHTCLQ